MKRVLLFENNTVLFDFNKWPTDGIKVEQVSMFRLDCPDILIRVLRNIGEMSTKMSLGQWFSMSEKFDCLIIPDIYFNINILRILSKKPKADKQILYYRNRIKKEDITNIDYAKHNGFIVSTYSIEDANQYDINFVPQCWNRNVLSNLKLTNTKDKTDVYFIGEAKNRYDQLIRIKNTFDNLNLNSKFQIVYDGKLPYTQKERVDYYEVLLNINSTKAILDIVAEDNWGLTIRPLEALMTNKKVITNYSAIKLYDFYRDNISNIFIWGEDNIERLLEFIETPFKPGNGIIYKYDNNEWIKRFLLLE